MRTPIGFPFASRAGTVLLLWLLCGRALAAAVDVSVEGVDNAVRKNVLLLLSIERQKHEPELTAGRIQALHTRAPEEIRAALQPFGYYRARIDATLERGDAGWSARYRIDPGPRLLVATLDLAIAGEGAADRAFKRLTAELPVREGAPLNHSAYEDAKGALQELAAERGYFDARLVRHELRIDLKAYTSEIVLHFDTGPRYRFGAVAFERDDGLREDLLARYVPFRQGEPFSHVKLLELQRALSDSEYFQRVEVRPRRDLARELEVPVEVQLNTRKPDRYTFGVGYGTDTGARGKVGWERRIVNEDGHRFGAEINASEIKSAVSARYLIPVGDPRTDRLTVTAAWIDDQPETSDSRTATLGVSLSQARGRWRETWSLNYHNERFRAGSDYGRASLFMPGANWLLTKADDPVYTRRGYRLQLDLRGAAEALGSDVSFLQGRVFGKVIYPLGANGRIIARADAGATSVRQFEELPASLRFYTGGDQSVRGYDYNTIGATDALGLVIGGKYLTVGSLEYEQRVYDRWSGAVFYDVGKAFLTSDEASRDGAGVGIRWRSPIGLVRVDVAWALSLAERPWRFHIVVGPDL